MGVASSRKAAIDTQKNGGKMHLRGRDLRLLFDFVTVQVVLQYFQNRLVNYYRSDPALGEVN